jgi:predicted nucleic acid-binding Zn ribbon protein
MCSKSCYWKSVTKPELSRRPCPKCGKEFKPRFAEQVTCSRECRTPYNRRPNRACTICGKGFNSKRLTQVTCGRDCGAALRRKERPNEHCVRCGKNLPPNTRVYRYYKYCSKACKKTPQGTRREHAQHGYMQVYIGSRWMQEHRYVMEQDLGRKLMDYETVHHINGDRKDNRIENLQLRMGKHGKGQAFRCADCGSCNIIAERLREHSEH